MPEEKHMAIPGRPVKGRGALSNPTNRYADKSLEVFDDGWQYPGEDPTQTSPVKTIILNESSRRIISTNQSPDIPFSQSINPYRGCEHGCIYCYARPTHAYWDLSPGIDFESKIIIKPNADQLLREALLRPGYVCKTICIGANTDPYQPLEARLKTTRSILEVLQEFQHPFTIITKSGLITRDLDILGPMAEQNLCSAAVSVTTLDNNLKRKLEPRAPSGRVRIEAIRALTEARVPVTLMAAPVIPCINDHELSDILTAGKKAGAISAGYILLRLPLEVNQMFVEWLEAHFPDRAKKVMNIIRQSRGGRVYQSEFGERMRGTGVFAKLINNRFHLACRKLGLNSDERSALSVEQFTYPGKQMNILF